MRSGPSGKTEDTRSEIGRRFPHEEDARRDERPGTDPGDCGAGCRPGPVAARTVGRECPDRTVLPGRGSWGDVPGAVFPGRGCRVGQRDVGRGPCGSAGLFAADPGPAGAGAGGEVGLAFAGQAHQGLDCEPEGAALRWAYAYSASGVRGRCRGLRRGCVPGSVRHGGGAWPYPVRARYWAARMLDSSVPSCPVRRSRARRISSWAVISVKAVPGSRFRRRFGPAVG